MGTVKPRRQRGRTRQVEAAGAGRIVLSRVEETLARYAGRLTGVYAKGSLRTLRREWR